MIPSDRVIVYDPQGNPSPPLFHADARDRVEKLGWAWEPPAVTAEGSDSPTPKKRATSRRRSAH